MLYGRTDLQVEVAGVAHKLANTAMDPNPKALQLDRKNVGRVKDGQLFMSSAGSIER
jgi:hypothetical protein